MAYCVIMLQFISLFSYCSAEDKILLNLGLKHFPNSAKTTKQDQFKKKGLFLTGLLLTVNIRGKKHSETTKSAFLIGPHSYNPHAIIQHQVIGHRAAELGLEVLDGAAAVVHGHKVLLALVRVFHLVVDESQVDLKTHRTHKKSGVNKVPGYMFYEHKVWERTS